MNESAQQKLAALRDRFVQAFPNRLDAIEQSLHGDPAQVERLLHSLAGTAGTYGFAEIAALARLGEESCGDGARVQAILDELRMMIDEPAPPAGRILCLEDDPDQAAYVTAILESANYEVIVVHEVAEFERVLEQFRPELLLLDVSLPDGNGIALAAALRRARAHAALPIIVLTGRASVSSRVDGIRAGADDYLVKPVPPDLLLATAESRLERARSVRTLIERDALTLAATRAAFLQAVEVAVRSGGPHCLVTLDIDHFKHINDVHGHVIGDRVLSLFGRFLRANVRAEDVVGRCGGEEFGILLDGTGADEGRALVERLLQRFARIPHAARGAERFHVTFSAGVAELEDGDDVESWRQRADDACYAAKRRGRSRVEAA